MNLITVPACGKCNGYYSKIDQKFAIMLATFLGGEDGAPQFLWHRAVDTLKKNKKFKKELLKTMEITDVYSPLGLWHGRRHIVKWDVENHRSIIERITRGLYHFKYNAYLPIGTKITTYFLKTYNQQMHNEIFKDLYWAHLADGQFRFSTGRIESHPFVSLWLYIFHDRHAAASITGDDRIDQLQMSDAIGEFFKTHPELFQS